MDITVLIGVLLGIFAIVGGMIAKGANLSSLINPAAIIIIFIGTIAAVCNSFPMDELKRVPALFRKIFTQDKVQDAKEIIDLIVEIAYQARKEGLLSLEYRLAEIEDNFIKKGLQLIIDGQDEDFVRDYLETDIANMEDRHASGALMFSSAGLYAPTLGVLGAVIGLIGALGHMEDTAALAKSVGAAFVATLFGIYTGYSLWIPFSAKLKRKSHEEVMVKSMALEGLLSIQRGSNPVAIKEKMMVFLTPTERDRIEAEES